MRILVLLSALSIVACVTVPPAPTPTPDTSACTVACSNLERLGCPEADPPVVERAGCVPVCEHMVSSGKFRLDVSCIVAARSVEAVRVCAGVRCER